MRPLVYTVNECLLHAATRRPASAVELSRTFVFVLGRLSYRPALTEGCPSVPQRPALFQEPSWARTNVLLCHTPAVGVVDCGLTDDNGFVGEATSRNVVQCHSPPRYSIRGCQNFLLVWTSPGIEDKPAHPECHSWKRK